MERQERTKVYGVAVCEPFRHVVSDHFGITHDHRAVERIVLRFFGRAVLDAGIKNTVDTFFEQVFNMAVDEFCRITGRI